eukprot:2314878-Pyramimonas_sp.AAC.2
MCRFGEFSAASVDSCVASGGCMCRWGEFMCRFGEFSVASVDACASGVDSCAAKDGCVCLWGGLRQQVMQWACGLRGAIAYALAVNMPRGSQPESRAFETVCSDVH